MNKRDYYLHLASTVRSLCSGHGVTLWSDSCNLVQHDNHEKA